MRLYTASHLFQCRRARVLLWATAIAAALAGCETVTTAPADAQLAGSWQLDKSASDDPEAAIAKAMNAAEARIRKRLARYRGDSGADSTAAPHEGAADEPDYSFDTPGDRYGGPGLIGPDFRALRLRLRQAMIPPATLQLQVEGELVRIAADQLPPRVYRLGERLSRFDEYGTAIITASWSHDEFVLSSRYTSHASRTDTYQVNAAGALIVTQQFIDPLVGRILVRSTYRRS